ncbi:IPT/TIG domain-containing protein [Compostibacter hankyongensis]|uniref:IPT/TIG domain-containing protein n=1 Tax=Compostibacter hankyongensis TaxID=1007089 RepID=A0ABP8FUS8_9BACT
MNKTAYILGFVLCCCACWSACTKSAVSTNGEDPYKDTVSPALKFKENGVTPTQSTVNQEVTLFGAGFAKNKDKLSILFNNQPAEILEVSDSSVRVKVPQLAGTGAIAARVEDQYFFGPFFRILGPLSMDTLFPSFRGADNSILDICPTTDNKFIIAGDFKNYDNANIAGDINHIALINRDGTIDRNNFKYGSAQGAMGSVSRVISLNNGKYLIAGSFLNYGIHSNISGIARINGNGMLDTVQVTPPSGNKQWVSAIRGGVAGGISEMHVQSDGKMMVIGPFRYYVTTNYDLTSELGQDSTHLDSTLMYYIARLNQDGTLDSSYHYDLVNHRGKETINGSINSSILLPDDKLLIAGSFTKYDGKEVHRIARLNPDGSLDPTFKSSPGADLPIISLTEQPDGKFLVVGAFNTYDGKPQKQMVRINADGSLDPTFHTAGTADGFLRRADVMPGGEIIVSGLFRTYGNIERNNFIVLNADGSIHETYNTNGGINLDNSGSLGLITKIVPLPSDHAFIMVGGFTKFDYRTANRIVRMTYQ